MGRSEMVTERERDWRTLRNCYNHCRSITSVSCYHPRINELQTATSSLCGRCTKAIFSIKVVHPLSATLAQIHYQIIIITPK